MLCGHAIYATVLTGIFKPSRLSAFTHYVKLLDHLANVQAAKSRPPLSRTPYVSGAMTGWRLDISKRLYQVFVTPRVLTDS